MEKELLESPYQYLLRYYDIIPMEEFEIVHMADSPYFFNLAGSLCNCRNEVRDEILNILLLEPERFKRCRKIKEI